MHPNDYQLLAARTESPAANARQRIATDDNDRNVRLLHAALGLATEAGEIADAVKRQVFYGKALDAVNVKEELGDLLWYVALACNAIGVIMADVMEANIVKLKVRYPDKYTDDAAVNRDPSAERAALIAPKEVTCKHCKGTGTVYVSDGDGGEAPGVCGMCGGIGQVKNPAPTNPCRDIPSPPLLDRYEQCKMCEGSGSTWWGVLKYTCRACHGTGEILMDRILNVPAECTDPKEYD